MSNETIKAELFEKGMALKQASKMLRTITTKQKNLFLESLADQIELKRDVILAANEQDMIRAQNTGMKESLLDRLKLTTKRIKEMGDSLRATAALSDPVGEIVWMKERPNGLVIGKKRVPLGVVGIIYEARPNVTVDAFSLCFKTNNVVLLRGGKEAFETNRALVYLIKDTLKEFGISPDVLALVESTERESALQMMKLSGILDVLIPRGSASLIQSVVENATVPVIETGTGNCHIFIDESADFNRAVEICVNAKVTRVGACNAVETLLVHRNIASDFLPPLIKAMQEKKIELRLDEDLLALVKTDQKAPITRATESDWETEYLDKILAIKMVDNIEEAIEHIGKYSTGHSEAILTDNYTNAQMFLNDVDSAAVYVNASTRFTDGFEFGFGAELGISTQKLHARGPMGLEELTTFKYIVYGNGQVRE